MSGARGNVPFARHGNPLGAVAIGWDGKAHVDFPAASPFALACGGTRLIAPAGAIQAESIWNQHSADTSPDAGQQGSFGSGGGGVSGALTVTGAES